jgi:hypothetical protein
MCSGPCERSKPAPAPRTRARAGPTSQQPNVRHPHAAPFAIKSSISRPGSHADPFPLLLHPLRRPGLLDPHREPPKPLPLPDEVTRALPAELAELSSLYLQLSSEVPFEYAGVICTTLHRAAAAHTSPKDALSDLLLPTVELFSRIRGNKGSRRSLIKIRDVLVSMGLKYYPSPRRKTNRFIRALQQLLMLPVGEPRELREQRIQQACRIDKLFTGSKRVADGAPLRESLRQAQEYDVMLDLYVAYQPQQLAGLVASPSGASKMLGVLNHHYRETFPVPNPPLQRLFYKLRRLPAGPIQKSPQGRAVALMHAFFGRAAFGERLTILQEVFEGTEEEEALPTFLLSYYACCRLDLRPQDLHSLQHIVLPSVRPSRWSTIMLLRICEGQTLEPAYAQGLLAWIWQNSVLDKPLLIELLHQADDGLLQTMQSDLALASKARTSLLDGSPVTVGVACLLLAYARTKRGQYEQAWAAIDRIRPRQVPSHNYLHMLNLFLTRSTATSLVEPADYRDLGAVAAATILCMRKTRSRAVRKHAVHLLSRILSRLVDARQVEPARRLAKRIPPRARPPLARVLCLGAATSAKVPDRWTTASDRDWAAFVRRPHPQTSRRLTRSIHAARMSAYARNNTPATSLVPAMKLWYRNQRQGLRPSRRMCISFARALLNDRKGKLAYAHLKRVGFDANAIVKEAKQGRRVVLARKFGR